ncbi:MAG: riboflavin synthase, partial [Armatimonadetes bacterium]|nr:riboflavin synthase [Armatimonadota bacterium]
MFTGIVESLGKVTHLERKPASLRLTIDAPSIARDARPGDSVCVNGVCLTVTAIVGATLCFDVVEESLRRSNLSETSVGSALNLEPSLRPDSRLGGHFVMGHVDAVGSVSRVVPEGDSERVYIQC